MFVMRVSVVFVTVKLFFQFFHASFQILDSLFIVGMFVRMIMIVRVCHQASPFIAGDSMQRSRIKAK